MVHGHSSHHPRVIEIYRNRLILYGCGDFLNDYEGIRGYEQYRDDLALMYFADLEPTGGSLRALNLVPVQIRNFRLSCPSRQDMEWVQRTLDRQMSAVRNKGSVRFGQAACGYPPDASDLTLSLDRPDVIHCAYSDRDPCLFRSEETTIGMWRISAFITLPLSVMTANMV